MIYAFHRHYTRDEARALLPQVRRWLGCLERSRETLADYDRRITALSAPGRDLGGEVVNKWVRTLANLQETLNEFYSREIQVKDLDRGLIDFPALLGGKEVFLCWEKSEDDIEFFHDLEAGYGGRQRIGESE